MANESTDAGMKGLRFRKHFFFLFFIVYLLVSVLGLHTSSKREFFPVFSWSLFTHVKDYSASYEVEIVRIDDMIYNPPRNYYDLGGKFAPARIRDPSILKSVRTFHAALTESPDEADALRETIESRFLSGYDRVDYKIVIVHQHPLRRVRTGEIDERIVIGAFSTGDHQ